MAKEKKLSTGQKVGIGASVAALAAAAAGAYYFYGSKKAGQHRKALKSWAVKAQGEIMERVEQMQDVSKDAYDKAVTQVMKGYRAAKKIAPAEISAMEKTLKQQWTAIAGQIKAGGKKTHRAANGKKK